MGIYSIMHTIWTVALSITFVGIIFWAWSGAQKRRFEEAARLPLHDDSPRHDAEERRHG